MKFVFEKLAKEQLHAAEEERKLQREIEKATAAEERVAEKLAPNAADVVLGLVSVGIFPAFRLSKVSKGLQGIHWQDKIDHLHDYKVKEVERQRKVLGQMEECARQIAQCSNKATNIREQTIPALHGAVGALSKLATIMQKAATFWKSMQQKCKEQCDGKLQQLIKDVAELYEDKEARLEVYRSPATKEHAVRLYASWVAMETVCDEYIKKIKVSREELYSYLCENPTIEESKARIKLLCREFSERIDEEKAKMEKQMKQIEEDKQKQSAESLQNFRP